MFVIHWWSDLVDTLFIAKMDAISCDKAAYFAKILSDEDNMSILVCQPVTFTKYFYDS